MSWEESSWVHVFPEAISRQKLRKLKEGAFQIHLVISVQLLVIKYWLRSVSTARKVLLSLAPTLQLLKIIFDAGRGFGDHLSNILRITFRLLVLICFLSCKADKSDKWQLCQLPKRKCLLHSHATSLTSASRLHLFNLIFNLLFTKQTHSPIETPSSTRETASYFREALKQVTPFSARSPDSYSSSGCLTLHHWTKGAVGSVANISRVASYSRGPKSGATRLVREFSFTSDSIHPRQTLPTA